MEDFDIDKGNEKFKSGIWKKVLKEFGYFKELLVPGILLGGLTGALDVVQPKMTKYVLDTFVKGRDLSNFNASIIFTVVFLLITAASTFFFIKFVGHLEIKMCHRLRTKCFTKLQSLSLSFYDKNAVG